MGRAPGNEYTLERIDVNGNYCPENVKWETRSNQNRNKRDNIKLYGFKTLEDFANHLGIGRNTLKYRLKSNWPEDKLGQAPFKGTRINKKKLKKLNILCLRA